MNGVELAEWSLRTTFFLIQPPPPKKTNDFRDSLTFRNNAGYEVWVFGGNGELVKITHQQLQ